MELLRLGMNRPDICNSFVNNIVFPQRYMILLILQKIIQKQALQLVESSYKLGCNSVFF